VNAAMNIRVPYNAGNLLSGLPIVGVSSNAQFHTVSWLLRYYNLSEY
jgi:hypothetical protein